MSIPPSISDEPPSAKLIYYALKRDGPMRYADIVNTTELPERTVTRGIHRLEDHDVIERDVFETLSRAEYRLADN